MARLVATLWVRSCPGVSLLFPPCYGAGEETTTTTAALRAPKDVKVLATNGTPTQGAAGRARDALRVKGYNVLAPIDAKPATASAVYFTPTFEREAQAVAEALALPPPRPSFDRGGAGKTAEFLAQMMAPAS